MRENFSVFAQSRKTGDNNMAHQLAVIANLRTCLDMAKSTNGDTLTKFGAGFNTGCRVDKGFTHLNHAFS
jgi:hypothetical protein